MHKLLTCFFVGLFLLAACSPQTFGQSQSLPDDVHLYLTLTPSLTPVQPKGLAFSIETPLPTPTPFTYQVKQGDTMSGIALRFGVSLDMLIMANPDVSPSVMPVGTVLKIPSNPQNPLGEPTPTPVPLAVLQVKCYPTADRGMWCLTLARNDYPDTLENLSALITLLDVNGQTIASQVAISLLNILPPGKPIPLVVFFPPDISPEVRPRAQILTAIRLLPGDSRYLPAILQNTLVSISWTGKTAEVIGQVILLPQSAPAGQVWVAGAAYDAMENVVGVRRWESDTTLQAGGNLPFTFSISSLGAGITRVELIVEARP